MLEGTTSRNTDARFLLDIFVKCSINASGILLLLEVRQMQRLNSKEFCIKDKCICFPCTVLKFLNEEYLL